MIKQTKQIGPRIPAELYKQVKIKCLQEDTTIDKVITQLLSEWAGYAEKPKPSPLFQPTPIFSEPQQEIVETPQPTPPKPTFYNVGGIQADDEPEYLSPKEAQDEWLRELEK